MSDLAVMQIAARAMALSVVEQHQRSKGRPLSNDQEKEASTKLEASNLARLKAEWAGLSAAKKLTFIRRVKRLTFMAKRINN